MAVHSPFIPHGGGAPAAAELPSRGSSQTGTQALSTSLSPSAKCALSEPFLFCPGRCLQKELADKLCTHAPSFLDRVSWRKMKCHLEPSASNIDDIQVLPAFPAPCHVRHQKTMYPSPSSPPTQSHTGHVKDTPLEIVSPYRS